MADDFPMEIDERRVEKQIQAQLKALPRAQTAFLQNPGPGPVHELRRSLRRLSFIQKLSATCGEARARPSSSVRRANRWLGRLRDIDVLSCRLAAERPYTLATNVDDLLAALLFHRRQACVDRATEALKAAELGGQFGSELSVGLREVRPGQLEAALRDMIARQDHKLRRDLDAETSPGPHAQHRLRRRARRLRYAIELLPASDASQAYLERLLDIHYALGDAHDRHVGKRLARHLLPKDYASTLDFSAMIEASDCHGLAQRLPPLPCSLLNRCQGQGGSPAGDPHA